MLVYKLIMFDLDGTLAESKSPLDPEMAALLCELLKKTNVAVISGASFSQFESQFLKSLNCEGDILDRLLLFPAQGGSLYRYSATDVSVSPDHQGEWKMMYENNFTDPEAEKIKDALDATIKKVSNEGMVFPETIYGERIENRGSQVTFSAIGQRAPIIEKASWDPDHTKRTVMANILKPLLPECQIAIGGMTSIDITKKGIDKEYGIMMACKSLGISKEDILYVGDSLFEGGNDYAAIHAGVPIHAVKNVSDTKTFIREYLSSVS